MSERKLATIQRIKGLAPIEGADMIELVFINGWQVVVKKGEHQVGELVIYLEIDSWVPTKVAPFLTKEGHTPSVFEGVEGERLKTIKLRKQLSQGLILPLDSSVGNPPILSRDGYDGWQEGFDVTDALGVIKWEKPEKEIPGRQVQAQGAKRFPSFIPKTDQERIQNYGEIVVRSLDEEFEATMKKDGSSMSVFVVVPGSEHYETAKALYKTKLTLWQKIKTFFAPKKADEPIYGICSRNVLLNLEGNSNFHTAAKPVLEAMKAAYVNYAHDSYAIQGEVVAPDIQDNYEKVDKVEFHVFDIFNIESQKYVTPLQRKDSVEVLGLSHVTVLATNSLRILFKLGEDATADDVVKAALTYASGPGDNKGVLREGCVFKATGRDFSFKAISTEYLLKKG